MGAKIGWIKSSQNYRTLDRIDGEPMEFEWNIFPRFTTLQICNKVQELLSRLSVTPENFTRKIIFISFNDISWRSRDNKIECESNAQLVSLITRRFGARRWSFLGPGPEKVVLKRTPSLPCHESIIQRSVQKQRWWKIVDTPLCQFGND